MPPSLTEQLDTLYSTTWEYRSANVHDNIFSATPFWFWLKDKGHFKTQEGGRFIMEPLEYAKNDSVSWIGRGGTVSLNDYEFITESKWDWKYVVASMVRFGIDEQKNRGKFAIIKKMDAMMANTDASLIDAMETQLFATQGPNTIHGLIDLIDDTPATTSLAGLDPATYTWWRNKATNMTGESFHTLGLDRMRTMLNNASTNRKQDRPDIILTAQTPYEWYEDEVMEQKQIVNQKLGDAGFENIQYKGIPIIWSPACASTRMYFLNTNFLHFIYDPTMNFTMTEWKPIPDQVNDRAAQIILACAFIVTRRLCQGVIYNIDTE